MIVFTATNLRTHDVYVGTARDSVEEEWADLLSQADSGASGQFFEQLREVGTAGFEVDTWAYGENAAEARESMREAREELGAQPIKSNRAQNAGRNTQAIQSASMKALMKAFEEAMNNDAPLDDDDLLDGLLEPAGERRGALLDEAEDLEDEEDDEPALRPSKPAARPTSAAALEPASPAPESVRKPVTAVAAAPAPTPAPAVSEPPKMNRLEAMKAAQEKLLRERDSRLTAQKSTVGQKAGTRAASVASRSVPPAPAQPEKMAIGRTGSAEKERRIRAAIEAERERRDALRHTSSREEQTEMNVVMARIEMRRLAAKKANAEKAKAAAAERRAKAKAEANLVKEAMASALKKETPVVPQPVTPALKAVAAPAPAAVSRPAAATPVVDKNADQAALKLAPGRTGSGQKEKRIREAIEQEKAHRLAQQQARRAAEAKEMADILARLEERTKAADKFRRRR